MNKSRQNPVLLKTILGSIHGRILSGNPEEVEIRSICADSREATPGSLFVALEGDTVDGHNYVSNAVENGAVAVILSQRPDQSLLNDSRNVVIIEVVDSKEALGIVASTFYGCPADGMTIVGVTGTNGKTTVTYLMEHVLSGSGVAVGVVGTVNYRYTNREGTPVVYPAGFTTPDPIRLYGIFREMRDNGVTHVVMEVSSHALEQKRLGPLLFDLAVFTNLSQDHLDYHHTMEDYFTAKCMLFKKRMEPGSVVVVYESGKERLQKRAWTDRLISLCTDQKLSVVKCGSEEYADFRLLSEQIDTAGTSFVFQMDTGRYQVISPLVGQFNIENLLVSVAALTQLDLSPEPIRELLQNAHGAPGRMQRVTLPLASETLPVVLVDYAHTPDALKNVLETAKTLPHRNLFCVFGCGGDRDRSKRAKMGAVAAQLADVVIVTDDNPRTEDPVRIRDEIISNEGIGRHNLRDIDWLYNRAKDESGCVEIGDRVQAIRSAMQYSSSEDIVLIAGKGHEQYQITASGKSFFDDCLVAQESALDWNNDLLAEAAGGMVKGQGKNEVLNQISTDSRAIDERDIFVALRGDSFNGHDFIDAAVQRGASSVVISEDRLNLPDHSACIKVEDTLQALGDLARFRRQALKAINNPVVVGITGSSGKTTVKEMTAAIFSKFWPDQSDLPPARVLKTEGNFNNLIGLPLSLLPATLRHTGIILEMGMNRPGEIARLTEIADPDIACITNVHSAHLEGLGTIENVARAKAELFMGMRPDAIQIVNLDDDRIVAWSRQAAAAKQITFGITPSSLKHKPDVWATDMSADSAGRMSFVLHVGNQGKNVSLQAPGLHNCSNCCAAAAICWAAGIDLETIVEGLEAFISTSKRMESMRSPTGLNILNDTYNANPASMLSALETLQSIDAENRVAVLGDMLELGVDAGRLHHTIGFHVARLKLDYLAVFGPLAKSIAEGALTHGMDPERVVIFEDKKRVVDWLTELLHSERLHQDDWVLIKASRGMALDSVVTQLMEQ